MKKISADKAYNLSRKSNIKNQLNLAFEEIKNRAKLGDYQAKIPIIDEMKHELGTEINRAVFNKLISLGYRMGSTESGIIRNIFWKPKN